MFRLGVLCAATLLSGCSLLYDSGKLPEQMVDAPVDAMVQPCMPTISQAFPSALHEGMGEGGGRPGLLVLQGASFAKDAVVKLTPTDAANAPQLELIGPSAVTGGGSFLAIQVISKVDPTLAAGTSIPLTVEVSQFCPDRGEMVSVSATEKLALRGYDELKTAAVVGTGEPKVYSMIDVTAPLTITGTGALILHSNSSVNLLGDINVSGAMATPGPGGQAGGGAGATGGGPGRGSAGPSGGGPGGAAGYKAAASGAGGGMMAGDTLVTSYINNLGSGGGGSVVLLGIGNPGGGGGGTIELTARGQLKVGNITSNGGNGTGGGGGGGGGSGGTIVLRGEEVDVGTLLVAGGGGSNTGSVGRIRIDTPVLTPALRNLASRGGTFPPNEPKPNRPSNLLYVQNQETVSFTMYGTAGTKVDVRVLNDLVDPPKSVVPVDFQGTDEARVRVSLGNGYNLICALPSGSNLSNTESTNCVEVAYILP